MSYVVNESCIRCKTMDCVDVCPVDCFYEGGQTILNVIGDLLADGCQVLRYAMEYKPVAELLAAFVQRKGGINVCAARFARYLGRGKEA